MKKIIAVFLSVTMLITASVAVNLFAVSAEDWSVYPLFNNDGVYTTGVTIYNKYGQAVSAVDLANKAHKGYPDNFIITEGVQRYLVWTDNTWMAENFGMGDIISSLQVCDYNLDLGYVEFVFSGTGFGIGTCDPNSYNMQIAVEIDGVAQTVDNTKASSQTRPIYLFETEGLANKTHVVKVTAIGGTVVYSMFKIKGTLGGAPDVLPFVSYPLFDTDGYTPGVSFTVNGSEVPANEVTSRLGQGYPANCYPQEAGVKYIIWSGAAHHKFTTAVRQCTSDAVVKITFTGTAIRLVTNYREQDCPAGTVKVKLDGATTNGSVNYGMGSTIDSVVFFDSGKLADGVHELEVWIDGSNLEWGWFDVQGTPGGVTADAFAKTAEETVLVDGGYYAAAADGDKTGYTLFCTAKFDLSAVTAADAKLGLYAFVSGNDGKKVQTSDITLADMAGKEYITMQLTDIPAGAAEADIVVVPYVTYGGRTVTGTAKTVTVGDFANWLGAEN